MKKIIPILYAFGCTDSTSTFEVRVVSVENSVVAVDGVIRAATIVDGEAVVLVSRSFSDYKVAATFGGFDVSISESNQQTFQSVFIPGRCGRSTDRFDWEREELVVNAELKALSLFRCEGPGGLVIVVVN